METIKVETKKCTKCNEIKSLDNYHKDKSKKDGHRGQCKKCELEKKKIYYQDNKDKRHEYERVRYHENEEVRIKKILRRRFTMALTSKGIKKCKSIIELAGCELDFLKKWFEYQYKILTNKVIIDWDDFKKNYHIDHVKSCDSFDLNNIEEQKECFNWKNLQLLTKSDNLSKGNKLILELINEHQLKVNDFLKTISN